MARKDRRGYTKKLICILTGSVANDGDDYSNDGEWSDDYFPMDQGVEEESCKIEGDE